MKLLHIADLHLDSALTSHLPPDKVRARRTELLGVLRRAVSRGVEAGVSAVLIAGDLFDNTEVSRRALSEVESVLHSYPDLPFYYLSGNHEKDALVRYGLTSPNLHLFGDTFTSYDLGENVMLYGRHMTERGMFNALHPDRKKKNILMLHGELRDRSDEGGVIGLGEIAGRGIDYLALGHYHTYSVTRIDTRGVAVYSGAPEGRGFDECGQLGAVILDTADFSHTFIPLARREIHDVEVAIDSLSQDREIRARIDDALRGIPSEDVVRVKLVGRVPIGCACDTETLTHWYADRYYYFTMKNKTQVHIEREDLAYDKSLFGEFARCVLEDETLTEEEKSDILSCGAMALTGEEWIHQ